MTYSQVRTGPLYVAPKCTTAPGMKKIMLEKWGGDIQVAGIPEKTTNCVIKSNHLFHIDTMTEFEMT